MILGKKKAIEMLNKISMKIILGENLEEEEKKLITMLIGYTVGDLEGNNVNDSTGRKEEN